MKKEIHPPYQEVLFVDSSNGFKFVCGCTLQPKEKETFEGKEYPVYRVAVSSASHPFFTKSKQFVDAEGRVDKFTKRYAKKKESVAKEKEAAVPVKKKTEKKAASGAKARKKKAE
jgi:large subunit ribosomal protein L31